MHKKYNDSKKEYRNNWYKLDYKNNIQKYKDYYQERKTELSLYYKNKYIEDPIKYNNRTKLWKENNSDFVKQINKNWKHNNKDKVAEYSAKRRSLKLQAIPQWFEDDLVNDLYKKANDANMQVDHIIPLNNKFVCGLHCIDNLQLLTAKENQEKSNKFNG